MYNYNKNIVNVLESHNSQLSEIKEEIKTDSVFSLPREMILEIFSYLNSTELGKCFQVNKTWAVWANDEVIWHTQALKIAFGKKQWETYFGDIGQEPSLPKDIWKILNSPCPFFPGEKIKETHMLVLVPETVAGEPLNLKTLVKLVSTYKGTCVYFQHTEWFIDWLVANRPNVAQSHWVLMTTRVIPESGNKRYVDQQALINQRNQQIGTDYEVPLVLDAATCILMFYVRFNKRPFSSTYTRCQEFFPDTRENFQSPVMLAFGNNAFEATKTAMDFDQFNYGVAALRKFF